jgi:hypothetical protein
VLQGERGRRYGDRPYDNDGRVTEREQEADGDGAFAFVHQLAGDVVDGSDVIGVDGMAQAETVSEKGGAEEDWVMVKREDGPGPGPEVEDGEDSVDRENLGASVAGLVVEQRAQGGGHRCCLRASAAVQR